MLAPALLVALLCLNTVVHGTYEIYEERSFRDSYESHPNRAHNGWFGLNNGARSDHYSPVYGIVDSTHSGSFYPYGYNYVSKIPVKGGITVVPAPKLATQSFIPIYKHRSHIKTVPKNNIFYVNNHEKTYNRENLSKYVQLSAPHSSSALYKSPIIGSHSPSVYTSNIHHNKAHIIDEYKSPIHNLPEAVIHHSRLRHLHSGDILDSQSYADDHYTTHELPHQVHNQAHVPLSRYISHKVLLIPSSHHSQDVSHIHSPVNLHHDYPISLAHPLTHGASPYHLLSSGVNLGGHVLDIHQEKVLDGEHLIEVHPKSEISTETHEDGEEGVSKISSPTDIEKPLDNSHTAIDSSEGKNNYPVQQMIEDYSDDSKDKTQNEDYAKQDDSDAKIKKEDSAVGYKTDSYKEDKYDTESKQYENSHVTENDDVTSYKDEPELLVQPKGILRSYNVQQYVGGRLPVLLENGPLDQTVYRSIGSIGEIKPESYILTNPSDIASYGDISEHERGVSNQYRNYEKPRDSSYRVQIRHLGSLSKDILKGKVRKPSAYPQSYATYGEQKVVQSKENHDFQERRGKPIMEQKEYSEDNPIEQKREEKGKA